MFNMKRFSRMIFILFLCCFIFFLFCATFFSFYSTYVQYSTIPSFHNNCFISTIIATCASASKFNELKNLVGSIHRFNPHRQLLIFNLGLTPKQYLESLTWKNCKIINFPFSQYPKHLANIWNFSWKGVAIDLALKESPYVFYFDGGIELWRNIDDEIKLFCDEGHFHVQSSPEGLDLRYVHRDCWKWLNMTIDEVGGRDQNMIIGGIQAWRRNHPSFKAWLACLLDEECVSPRNSGVDNHLQDQSALSVIIYSQKLLFHKKFYDVNTVHQEDFIQKYRERLPWVVTRAPRRYQFMKSIRMEPSQREEIDWQSYRNNFEDVLEISHPRSSHVVLQCLWKNQNNRTLCKELISKTKNVKQVVLGMNLQKNQ